MKNRLLILILLLAAITVYGQNYYTSKENEVHLLGKIDLQTLKESPYGTWFNRSIKNDYKLEYSEYLTDTKVKIFLGTWCGDSKEWVPEFVDMWNQNNLSKEQLELIALHNEEELYKRCPEELEKGLNIHRVPTFIFYKNGEEIGRIVESPVNDLRTDVDQIAIGLPSKPRYRAASEVYAALKTNSADSLLSKNHYRKLLYDVHSEISRPSELNTLGYVFKAAGEPKRAELAFYLNRNIYQFDPNCWDSLGEIYFYQGRFLEAQFCYEKVVEMAPGNQNAIEMLKKIEEKVD